MSKPNRQMALVAFMQAQNCTNYTGAWRHAASVPDFLTPEYYQRIARTLEDGKIDLAFFDDRLDMPDIYGADHRATVENGIRAVKLDPTPVLMAMSAVTSHLGLGATYSTTYYEPYHVARLFATLDLMTRGRVAWNVVTRPSTWSTTCATTARTSSWRPCWACGTAGRMARSSSTRSLDASPIRTRSTAWTTRGSSSARAGR